MERSSLHVRRNEADDQMSSQIMKKGMKWVYGGRTPIWSNGTHNRELIRTKLAAIGEDVRKRWNTFSTTFDGDSVVSSVEWPLSLSATTAPMVKLGNSSLIRAHILRRNHP